MNQTLKQRRHLSNNLWMIDQKNRTSGNSHYKRFIVALCITIVISLVKFFS